MCHRTWMTSKKTALLSPLQRVRLMRRSTLFELLDLRAAGFCFFSLEGTCKSKLRFRSFFLAFLTVLQYTEALLCDFDETIIIKVLKFFFLNFFLVSSSATWWRLHHVDHMDYMYQGLWYWQTESTSILHQSCSKTWWQKLPRNEETRAAVQQGSLPE